MGRYDGEEYEYVAPCRPDQHSFGWNGTCFICRHTKDELLKSAEATIKALK